MRPLRVLVQLTSAVALFFFVCTLLLLLSLRYTVTSSRFWLGVLDTHGAFEQAAAELHAILRRQLPQEWPEEVREAFDEGLGVALTPEAVRQLVLPVLDRAEGFLAGRYPDLILTIPLAPIRTATARAVLDRLSSETIRRGRAEMDVGPSVSDEEFVLSLLRMPDTVTVTELWKNLPARETVVRWVGYFRLAMPALCAAIGLLVLLSLLASGVSGGLRWVGAVLLGAGLLILVGVTVGAKAAAPSLSRLLAPVGENLLHLDLQTLAGALLSGVMRRILTLAASVMAVGLVSVLAATVVRPRRRGREGRLAPR